MSSLRCWIAIVAALPATCAIQPRAAAQAVPSAANVNVALFRTAVADPALRGLGEALDSVVLDELDRRAGVVVSARPPIDLPGTQLALDCVGETNECLGNVADQAAVDVLLAPAIERAGDESVVTLLYFDARAGELRRALRRHPAPALERTVLDAVPEMMAELLPAAEGPAVAPPPAEVPAPAKAEVLTDIEAEPAMPETRPFPVVPVVIGVAGLALAGVGIAFGVAANSAEDDYAKLPLRTTGQIDVAVERFEEAQSHALLANIGIGVGAAAFALGAALLVIELSDDDGAESTARLSPQLGPGHAGLSLRGSFAGGL